VTQAGGVLLAAVDKCGARVRTRRLIQTDTVACQLEVADAAVEVRVARMVEVCGQVVVGVACDVACCEHAERELLLVVDLSAGGGFVAGEGDGRGGFGCAKAFALDLNGVPVVVVELGGGTGDSLGLLVAKVD